MPDTQASPLKTYVDHLERGELAYQFSPEARQAVFYPRVLCPFTGSDRLEWRVSKGLGTVYATTVVHPAEGKPFNVALIDCDEGFRLMSRVEDIAPERCRSASACASGCTGLAARRRPIRCSFRRRARDGGPEARQRGDRRGRRIRSRPGGRWPLRHRPDGAGHQARARRCGLEPEGRRRLVLRHHARAVCRCWRWPSIWASTRHSSAPPSSAAPRSSTTWPTPWAPSRSACATSPSSPTAARSAASGASRPPCARSTPTRRRSSRSCQSSAYALAASRHMHEFGTTREQLAAVAVAAREWALLNPAAWEKKPLTIEGVLSSRMVSYPFTVRDCCLVTDGGGAIVVTSAERARSLKQTTGLRAGLRPVGHPRQHFQHAGPHRDRALWLRARPPTRWPSSAPPTCDAVELYDAFTINTDPVPGGPRLLQEGRGRRVRQRAAASRPRAASPSTPTAAASPIATPACTGCSC